MHGGSVPISQMMQFFSWKIRIIREIGASGGSSGFYLIG
jgi:hypothetical protein